MVRAFLICLMLFPGQLFKGGTSLTPFCECIQELSHKWEIWCPDMIEFHCPQHSHIWNCVIGIVRAQKVLFLISVQLELPFCHYGTYLSDLFYGYLCVFLGHLVSSPLEQIKELLVFLIAVLAGRGFQKEIIHTRSSVSHWPLLASAPSPTVEACVVFACCCINHFVTSPWWVIVVCSFCRVCSSCSVFSVKETHLLEIFSV